MSKAPNELHLTFKEQWEWAREDWEKPLAERIKIVNLPLAFAQVYEPNKKGWEKKKDTQMKWAYGSADTWEEREDGIWMKESKSWFYPTHGQPYLIDKPPYRVEEYLQPRVIKNDPMSGFKIVESVSRYSTSNKLWRIEDPRGFELEISTGNMEAILKEGCVLKNEIQGTLQWFGKTLAYV